MTLRVLVPTDFSPAAGKALAVARAAFPDARPHLLHVAPPRPARSPAGEPAREREALDALGGGALASGPPAEEVLRCARQGAFDLIVLGKAGPRQSERGAGPVTERVIRDSPVPVLSVSAAAPPVPGSGARVLLLMDFSPGALGALDFLRRSWPDAQIQPLHVVDPGALDTPLALPMLSSPPALRGASTRLLRERNELWEREARGRLEGLGGGEVAWGPPAEVALDRARRGECDVIALGTSAKRGLDRLLFGSVARRIVRESPVPVLTVSGPLPKPA
ncbi:universal stress protein [Deinococcus planocerae]|uniref:universal stress protein n=1 Tax=Deinococcus planocerae TaxID=1737569 RepID=UPI000C7F526D|nr:universal stress protein [Deinococcus planocerae]